MSEQTERPSAGQIDGDQYRVMVPMANPEHASNLIELGAVIANHRGGILDAVHVITVPDQTDLQQAADQIENFDTGSADLFATARDAATTFGVEVSTHRILSHRGFKRIFDAAQSHDANLVVMGWGEHGLDRAESRLEEFLENPPCDFLVLRNRGFDPERILVPTAGGPDSELSAEVARLFQREYGSEVTLLHVASTADEGEQFLNEWAASQNLETATLRVETGDVETAIGKAATEATMIIIGATERGVLTRLLTGSVVMDVVDDVNCSVLLAERPTERTLRERVFNP